MVFKNATPPLTLAAAIGATDTTVTVVEDVSWVTPPMTFVIDRGLSSEEAVYVTAVNTSTKTLTLIRGADGYTPQSHVLGAKMEHVVLAGNIWMPQIVRRIIRSGSLPSFDARLHWVDCSHYYPTVTQRDGTLEQRRIYFTLVYFSRPMRIKRIYFNTGSTAGSGDGTTYIGVYTAHPVYVLPYNRIFASGPITVSAANTAYIVDNVNVVVEPGLYWVGHLATGYTTLYSLWIIGNGNSRVSSIFYGVANSGANALRDWNGVIRTNFLDTLPNSLAPEDFQWGWTDAGFPLVSVEGEAP